MKYVILLAVAAACTSRPALYLNKQVITEAQTVDSVYRYTGAYLEMELTTQTLRDRVNYLPKKALHRSSNPMRLTDLFVCDDSGKLIKFSSAEEFLNYAAERGYVLVSEQRHSRYTVSYRLKRE